MANTSFLAEHQKQLATAAAAAAPAAGKAAKPVKALHVAEKARAMEQRKEAERAEKKRQMQLAKEAKKATAARPVGAGALVRPAPTPHKAKPFASKLPGPSGTHMFSRNACHADAMLSTTLNMIRGIQ